MVRISCTLRAFEPPPPFWNQPCVVPQVPWKNDHIHNCSIQRSQIYLYFHTGEFEVEGCLCTRSGESWVTRHQVLAGCSYVGASNVGEKCHRDEKRKNIPPGRGPVLQLVSVFLLSFLYIRPTNLRPTSDSCVVKRVWASRAPAFSLRRFKGSSSGCYYCCCCQNTRDLGSGARFGQVPEKMGNTNLT